MHNLCLAAITLFLFFLLLSLCLLSLSLYLSVRLMCRQGYSDLDLLLFIAETCGKASMHLLQTKQLRHKFFNSMWAVFSAARGSAWSFLLQQHNLDLSVKPSMETCTF